MDSSERQRKLGIFKDIYESMENIDDITLFLISCGRFEIEKYKYIYIYIYYKRLQVVYLNLHFSFLVSKFIVTNDAKNP